MKKIVDAEIYWVPYSEGGRSSPIPLDIKYGPIIMFKGQEINEKLWSAEVYVVSDHDNGSSKIRLTYLSPEAPMQNLSRGRLFELFEGPRLVARGRIL